MRSLDEHSNKEFPLVSSANLEEAALKGMVLRIEKTSIHDGQGLRTVVFLKGCPLACQWCSTPESQHFQPERGYRIDACRLCGRCVSACPQEALALAKAGDAVLINQEKCRQCFTCVDRCLSGAVKPYGQAMSVLDVVREISKDEIFYFHSGGGLTVSGGEPLSQAAFTAAILQEVKMLGIHTALETSLFVPYPQIERVLPWLDVLYADCKHMDSQRHKELTGRGNELVLENLKKVDQSTYPVAIIVRIPLIPGITDTDDNLREIARWCRNLKKVEAIELLPYHRLGMGTYLQLAREYGLSKLAPPQTEQILERADFLRSQNPGMPVRLGGGWA